MIMAKRETREREQVRERDGGDLGILIFVISNTYSIKKRFFCFFPKKESAPSKC